MKVVILAGGKGTRIGEESSLKPKPMIEIGGQPILWHIMKHYSSYGFNEFVICCGYKGDMIKDYFANYYMHHMDVTFDFTAGGKMSIHTDMVEPWKVTLVDTGLEAMTGARIRKVRRYLGEEAFMLTYGDGVSDVDLKQLLQFHKEQKAIGTLTAIQPEGRFGILDISNEKKITNFEEKGKESGGWINGGFMVLEPEVFDYIGEGENVIFERTPLEQLAKEGKLAAYQHRGFWHCMDTMQDKNHLNQLWDAGNCCWL